MLCVSLKRRLLYDNSICFHMDAMAQGTHHRTTIEIDAAAFKEASSILGTRGFKQTVNEALREIARTERLRRGAALIRSGDMELVTPEELSERRQPRVD